MFWPQEVGEAMAGEAAGADQLDLEAAEQLIQLSGGDGDGGSELESRSWDSVKCRSVDQAGVKEKEVAVESRRRRRSVGRFVAGKDGNGGVAGEPGRKSADSVNKCSGARATSTEGKGKEEEELAVESRRRGAGVVDDGEETRRPRFRWLADIYRETRQLVTRDLRAAAVGEYPPEADERWRKRKRAADAGDVRGGDRSRAVDGIGSSSST